MTEKQLRQKRDREAEAMGEGSWRNPTTGEWCAVTAANQPGNHTEG